MNMHNPETLKSEAKQLLVDYLQKIDNLKPKEKIGRAHV
jgi:hypothetical protein